MIIFFVVANFGNVWKKRQCELVNANEKKNLRRLRIESFKGERSMMELVAVVRELVLARGHGVAHRVREVLVV